MQLAKSRRRRHICGCIYLKKEIVDATDYGAAGATDGDDCMRRCLSLPPASLSAGPTLPGPAVLHGLSFGFEGADSSDHQRGTHVRLLAASPSRLEASFPAVMCPPSAI